MNYVFKKLLPLKILTQVQSPWPTQGNFLHKNTSHDIYIEIGPSVFCTAHAFIQTPKSYALQCLSVSQTPKNFTRSLVVELQRMMPDWG